MSAPLDRPREACGVFGVAVRPEYASDLTHRVGLALRALQHRGQESAGVAISDGARCDVHVGMGLVARVFDAPEIGLLRGHLAIGHNRYSTTGASHIRNAQPYLVETLDGPLGVAHNGNLTNVDALRDRLLRQGAALTSASDSELLARLLAQTAGESPAWEDRLLRMMGEAAGAYSLTLLTADAVWGVRDPHGLRPLCVGELVVDGAVVGPALASESVAHRAVGARLLRDVRPGEVVRVDGREVRSWQGPVAAPALCSFEYVYFARPDSRMESRSVVTVRERLGARLAREAPADADVVIDVPDSGKPAAMGYARERGIPYREGLIKDRDLGRTFIEPNHALRRDRIQLKYSPVAEVVSGQRVVVVDDSVVRGNTIGPMIRLLREAGAREVHVRVASPPVRHPCFMGVDMSDYDELIAHKLSIPQIGAAVGADSFAFLSVAGLREAVGEGLAAGAGHCEACFTGSYPVAIPRTAAEKHRFEAHLAAEGPG